MTPKYDPSCKIDVLVKPDQHGIVVKSPIASTIHSAWHITEAGESVGRGNAINCVLAVMDVQLCKSESRVRRRIGHECKKG